MRLGISEAEWQNYSPEKREQIKSGYYEMLKNKFHEEKAVSDGSTLHVRISDGQVTMPPFSNPVGYTPVEFDIGSGDCQTVEVHDLAGNKKVPMKVCYQNKTLYLDSSRYDKAKRLGSIQLHYSPIWERGFTYQGVSSSGYVHLTNVNVALRKYDTHESSNEAAN